MTTEASLAARRDALREAPIGGGPVADVTARGVPGVWRADLPWTERAGAPLSRLL